MSTPITNAPHPTTSPQGPTPAPYPRAKKLDEFKVRKIIEDILNDECGAVVAARYGVTQGHVSTIMYLRCWRQLPHSSATIAKWRDWLGKPIIRQVTRSKGGRNCKPTLKRFDMMVKCSDFMRK